MSICEHLNRQIVSVTGKGPHKFKEECKDCKRFLGWRSPEKIVKEELPVTRQLIDQFHSLDYLSRQGVLKNWLLTWLNYYGHFAAENALGKAFQDPQVSVNEKSPGQRNYKAIELKDYPKEKLFPYKDEITAAIRAMELMFFYYDGKQEKYTNWETAMYSKVTGNKPRKLSMSVEIARKLIPPESSERDKEFEKGQLALI